MEHLKVSQCLSPESIGKKVAVQGWIRNARTQKGIAFVELNDGSCLKSIQCVLGQNLAGHCADISKANAGASAKITGNIVKSPAKGQTCELAIETFEIVGECLRPESYPMAPKAHSMEHLRDHAHLRARSNIGGAVARTRSRLAQAIHAFFAERGFLWVASPIITASDCEGAGEMFQVTTLDPQNPPKNPLGQVDYAQDFFGKKAFLTVSGQLNGETYACALSNIYTFGPTFRAENSNTSRHLAEFWMVEPEIAFADLALNSQIAQELLVSLAGCALEQCAEDMAFFRDRVDPGAIARLENLRENRFVRMDYADGVKILQQSGKAFENPVSFGTDLASEHERFLCEEYAKAPVILMNYPKDIKAFYMRQNDDGQTVAAMDVLAPGIGEIIGGSQREERLDVLLARMEQLGLNPDDYSWYLDLRRYGSVPHSGFGLGFERLVSYFTGVANVRDVIPFPRTPNNAKF